MAIEKQPDSGTGDAPNKLDPGELSEAADLWLRQFLKVLEIEIVNLAENLPNSPSPADCSLAALRAVKLTLLDSGIHQDELVHLLGRVALEQTAAPTELVWNAELNRRRFELIDKDIQGTLSQEEKLELAGLTQLMREQVDSEMNLPLQGARKLHQRLTGFGGEAMEPDQE